MQTSESIDKIIPAMLKAHAEFKSVAKSGYNQHFKFKFSDIPDYKAAYKEALANNGMFIMTSPCASIVTDYNRGEKIVAVQGHQRIFHESCQWIEIDIGGEGQDAGDKALSKAMTQARKFGVQGLLDLYGVEIDGDSESETKSTDSRDEKAVDHAAEHKARMAAIAQEMKDYVATKPREFTHAEMKSLFRDAGSDLAAWKKLIDAACESFVPVQGANDDDGF